MANRQVSDAARINFLIQRIQAKFEDCTDLFWTPLAREAETLLGCFDDADKNSISGVAVPRGLQRGGTALSESGRDARNNIFVQWTIHVPGESEWGLPSDSALCWMYVSATGSWVEGYDD